MHSSTSSGSLDLPALSAAERLFIWGFRAKARSSGAVPTAADIQEVYDHFRVGDAVLSLESIIEIFACTAHTAIEVHCPTCPRMSDSEHGILHAIAAAQQDRVDVAREQFELAAAGRRRLGARARAGPGDDLPHGRSHPARPARAHFGPRPDHGDEELAGRKPDIALTRSFMNPDNCASAAMPDAGQMRHCPLQAALAAPLRRQLR